jgi:molybdopterin molybdotransferase
MLSNITLENALDCLLSIARTLPAEKVSLPEATGRILARDLPEMARSAVDGYTIHERDMGQCLKLRIKEYMTSGQIPDDSLEPGETLGVVTGGQLPAHTGAVLPYEIATVDKGRLHLRGGMPGPGDNIRPAGEDFLAGELLAHRDTLLNAGLIGALATFGQSEVKVTRRPGGNCATAPPPVINK